MKKWHMCHGLENLDYDSIATSKLWHLQVLNKKLDEAGQQISYLKESMAGGKVEYDLFAEKMTKELEARNEHSQARHPFSKAWK